MSDQAIVGGRELDALLQTLPAKVEANIMRAALRAGANEFKEEIKANIPVDSGALRRSVQVSTRSKKGRVTASVKIGNKTAWYGLLLEFGTQAHKIRPKNGRALVINGRPVTEINHPGIAPRPFARPAADARAAAAVAAVAAKIRERLTKEGINTPAPEGE